MFTRACHWSLSWARWIQSTPFHLIFLNHSLTLFSHLRLGLSSGLFPSGFPTQIFMHFSFHPCVLHSPPIPSSFTWSPKWYSVKHTSYEAPHYVVFSSLLLTSCVLGSNILPNNLFLDTLNLYSCLSWDLYSKTVTLSIVTIDIDHSVERIPFNWIVRGAWRWPHRSKCIKCFILIVVVSTVVRPEGKRLNLIALGYGLDDRGVRVPA